MMKSVLFILGIMVALNIDGTAQVTRPDTAKQDTSMHKKKTKKSNKPSTSKVRSYIYQNPTGNLALNYQDTMYREGRDTGMHKRDTTYRKKNTRDRSSGSGNMNSFNYDQGNYIAINYSLAQDTMYRQKDRMHRDSTAWPDTSYMNKDKKNKNKNKGTGTGTGTGSGSGIGTSY